MKSILSKDNEMHETLIKALNVQKMLIRVLK